MLHRIFEYAIRIITLLSLVYLPGACKKTDAQYDYMNNLPSLANAGIKSSYSVGDTMILKGRLFAASGNLIIRVGQANAVIVKRDSVAFEKNYTHEKSFKDIVYFIITKAMGIGDNIPVSITTNGYTISGPSITIHEFALPSGRTDTTLYVDKLLEWQPDNPQDYLLNNAKLPVLVNSSVTGDGKIYFSNPLGIFVVSNNQVTRVLKKDQPFIEGGNSFSATRYIGSTISVDGNTLFFSAEVTDPLIDPAKYYAFRLCRMDMASGTVQTLNKTTLLKTPPASGFTDQAPYEGAAAAVKLIAVNLKTNAAGDLFFVNNYCSASANSSSRMNLWYNYTMGGRQLPTLAIYNICRLPVDGKLQSVIKHNSNNSQAPGYPAQTTSDYVLSPDGSGMYVVNVKNNSNNISYKTLLRYNPQTGDPEMLSDDGGSVYRFYSFDTAVATTIPNAPYQAAGYNVKTGNFLGYELIDRINALVLPGGDNLLTNGQGSRTLVAVNIPARTFYAYAGTERSIVKIYDQQNQETGPAKWVDFSKMGTAMAFCGLDRSGAIYCMKGDGKGLTPPTRIVFYKLYSRR